mmetsp:Transcript_58660/g.136939  ORF Transcript_58660/g.136939 Transcript_58660/m.136939 type:complete len:150 (-) Transcript_58660:17-466(-)
MGESCRGPADIRYGVGANVKGNPVVPRQKEDKEFAAADEERRKRWEDLKEERLRQRRAEGGRGGGLNDRQDLSDRRTFVDDSGFDDFGRRRASSSSTARHCQDKRDRMNAALERLRCKGQSGQQKDDRGRSRSPSQKRPQARNALFTTN